MGNNADVILSVIKMFFTFMVVFYTNNKILGIKEDRKIKKLTLVVISLIISLLYYYIDKFNIIEISNFMYTIIVMPLIYSIINRFNLPYIAIISSISLAINKILIYVASTLIYFPSRFMNLSNEYVIFTLIMIINIIFLVMLWKTKRIKNGIAFLKNKQNDEYLNLLLLIISSIILFLVVIIQNYQKGVTSKFGMVLIIFSILMFITIQKSLQLYYKHKMLVKALEETQNELNKKKEEVKKLEEENLNFSKTSHSIAHRQKSIEHKLNILLANEENLNSKDIENEINNIRKELESETKIELQKTGIAVIDDMLSYMQAECIKNNINFQLQITGNIHYMVNNYIDKSDLEILLADHVKDAIIAVNHVKTKNKSILVRIGKIDGIYGVYFYDSGVEFTIDTLIKLGKVPVTTYKGEGGSGMGFMNSFNTLNKYKATLIIEELNKPTNDNFTKVLKFIFNKEENFKIISYRNKEIANKDNNKELIIEKLQK